MGTMNLSAEETEALEEVMATQPAVKTDEARLLAAVEEAEARRAEVLQEAQRVARAATATAAPEGRCMGLYGVWAVCVYGV